MKRREFITLVGGAAAAWSSRAHAQQRAMPVIGYLEGASQAQFSHLIPAFLEGLGETGYSEHQNVRFDYRWAEGQYDRLPELAADLVRANVTLIFATALNSALAAKAATATTPVVFISGRRHSVYKHGCGQAIRAAGRSATVEPRFRLSCQSRKYAGSI